MIPHRQLTQVPQGQEVMDESASYVVIQLEAPLLSVSGLALQSGGGT